MGFLTDIHDPAFWVSVAFVIFVGIVIWQKAPANVMKSLDERADKIRAELDEARTLREEAQALLAQYQRKQRDVAKEAEDMVALSKAEAKRFAVEGGKAMDALIERRTKAAAEKISQAETQAIKEVRAAAVEIAINAAEKVIRQRLADSADGSDPFVAGAIEELDKQLH